MLWAWSTQDSKLLQKKKKCKFYTSFLHFFYTYYYDLKHAVQKRSFRKLLLHTFYKKRSFIKILKLNSELGSGNVLNTNICEISICDTLVKNKVVIFSAIDNLVKGASGQAIQNMNLIYKFPETLGLK